MERQRRQHAHAYAFRARFASSDLDRLTHQQVSTFLFPGKVTVSQASHWAPLYLPFER